MELEEHSMGDLLTPQMEKRNRDGYLKTEEFREGFLLDDISNSFHAFFQNHVFAEPVLTDVRWNDVIKGVVPEIVGEDFERGVTRGWVIGARVDFHQIRRSAICS